MWIFIVIIVLFLVYKVYTTESPIEKEARGDFTISSSKYNPVVSPSPIQESPFKSIEVTNEVQTQDVVATEKYKKSKERIYIDFAASTITKLNEQILEHAKLNNYKIIDITISAVYITVSYKNEHFAIVTFEHQDE